MAKSKKCGNPDFVVSAIGGLDDTLADGYYMNPACTFRICSKRDTLAWIDALANAISLLEYQLERLESVFGTSALTMPGKVRAEYENAQALIHKFHSTKKSWNNALLEFADTAARGWMLTGGMATGALPAWVSFKGVQSEKFHQRWITHEIQPLFRTVACSIDGVEALADAAGAPEHSGPSELPYHEQQEQKEDKGGASSTGTFLGLAALGAAGFFIYKSVS